MNPAVANMAIAAAATITAALDSQLRNTSALKTVASSEIGRPATSCFHSHFRSKLLDKISFDNTLFTDSADVVVDEVDDDATLNRIHPHMWSKRHYTDPPVECFSTDDDCGYVNRNYTCTTIDEALLTRLYGPRYASSLQKQKAASFIFNGIPLLFGKAYCLPQDLIPKDRNRELQGICDHISGELEISYDDKQGRFVSKCFCKWPDFFSGPFCDEYVGCKVNPALFGEDIHSMKWTKPTNARLINRDDTTDSIANIKDLHAIWHKHNGNVDLYATSKQLTHTQGPAWYCKCKEISRNLTGGMIAGSCIADPCLPSTQYLRFHADESPQISVLRGTSDDRDPKLERWNCDCGDRYSAFFGGGDTPCATLVNLSEYRNYDPYEMVLLEGDTIRTIRNVTCFDNRKIFMPCKNRYRPYFSMSDQSADFLKCSDMGFPGVVNPDELPEAGACIDVCHYCSTVFQSVAGNKADTDVCSADVRMWGICAADNTKNNANPNAAKYNFKCSCGLDPKAKVWDVTTPRDGPCIGKPKPCKTFNQYCTVALDRSPQGPECYSTNPCSKMPFMPAKCVQYSNFVSGVTVIPYY